jgi:hypothetical protein
MASNKEKAAAAEATAATYERRELVANSVAIFGVKPEVLIGALNGNKNKTLTVAEAQSALDTFLKKVVK